MMDNKENVIALFKAIISDFPKLSMRFEPDPKNVDVSIDIARQPGLPFDINLNLQGDELHIAASAFCCEWVPSTNSKVIEEFRKSVCGLLSGEYRILEHYRGEHPVRSELQRMQDDNWKTVATWMRPHLYFFKKTSKKILRANPVTAHDSN